MSKRITPISYKKLIKLFEKFGFKFSRYHGDHVVMNKAGAVRPIVFQALKDVPVFQIENNLKVAKLTKAQYLEMLESL